MAQGAQTADRAIELLVIAAANPEPMSLAELGEASGLNKPTTYRIVQSLVTHDMLTREPDGRRYMIGSGLIAVAGMVMQKLTIAESARPVMKQVAMETSETVSLHLRHARERVCIATVESSLPVRRVVPLGETLPIYSGSTGKVMLAFLPETEIDDVIAGAAADGADTKPIRGQLEVVRDQGYLYAVGERTPGVGGLSVPVFGADGVTAAVTVSGPGERFGLEAMAEVAPAVRAACAGLSSSLGFVGPLPGVAGDEDVPAAA